MKKAILIWILLLTGSWTFGQQTFNSLVMPDHVEIGMSLSSFNNIRTNAFKTSFGARTTNYGVNLSSFSEMSRDESLRYVYQYNFVSNHLRSVVKSYGFIRQPGISFAEIRQPNVSFAERIHNSLSNSFAKCSDEKIYRINNVQPILVPMEFWTNKNDSTGVFFISRTNELSIFTFDTRFFGRQDFFLGEEDAAKLTNTLEKVRRTTQSSQETNK